jgi:hypothetical protein
VTNTRRSSTAEGEEWLTGTGHGTARSRYAENATTRERRQFLSPLDRDCCLIIVRELSPLLSLSPVVATIHVPLSPSLSLVLLLRCHQTRPGSEEILSRREEGEQRREIQTDHPRGEEGLLVKERGEGMREGKSRKRVRGVEEKNEGDHLEGCFPLPQ